MKSANSNQKFRNLKLRPSAVARYSSSTSVEAYSEKIVGWLVGWLVCHKKLWYFHSNDFPETLHDDKESLVGDFVLSGFWKKILVHP